ncbi:MAG: hypothetical protein DMF70_15675 [Acidobacteria bacterium]|nr:MAG: hypothetical protein DMF70_15675 [Acidobacteriota bacterium]
MPSPLTPLRFNDLLGRDLLSRIKGALTSNELLVTNRTLFGIAAWNMQFTLEYPAVRTRVFFCAPIVSFVTIGNARN